MWPVAPICTPVACSCVFLGVVAQRLKQLPTFPFFHDCQSVAQHCWICLPTPFNIVGARHPRYSWSCGLYPSHDALQVTTLLGVVTSICTPLPTHTQQLPIMLGVATSFRMYLKKTWFQPLSQVQSCSFLHFFGQQLVIQPPVQMFSLFHKRPSQNVLHFILLNIFIRMFGSANSLAHTKFPLLKCWK